jgi:hypothetical protein
MAYGTDLGEWIALGYRDGHTFFEEKRVFVTAENHLCPWAQPATP